MNRTLVSTSVSVAFIVAACSGSSPTAPDNQGGAGAGGGSGAQTGGVGTLGGRGGTNASPTGGTNSGPTGGANANPTGGANANPTGGSAATGGTNANPTGGNNPGPTGGNNPGPTGGNNPGPTGGNNPGLTGGTNSSATGGRTGIGGTATGTGGINPGTGGKTGMGGTSAANTSGTGAVTTGGKSSTGGAANTGGSGGTTTGCVVQLDSTHQTIEGFGINDTWGSQFSTTQADQLFTTTSGIGLSILRVGMSPSGSFYNSFESSNISAAKTRGAKIIGSTWSPPANCKDNNNTQKGGHLLTSCYGSWSDTITNFAKNNSLYAMSAGNEPEYASCASSKGPPCNDADYDTTLYTAKEMVAFVNVLGPKLHALNPSVKLITPEASEWLHVWSNLSVSNSTVAGKPNSSDPLNCGCFQTTSTGAITGTCATTCTQGNGYDYGHWLAQDATAWGYVDILGVHQYDSQIAEPWPADVNGGIPNKSIWQTEMSGVMYWPEAGPSTTIENGVAVAGWLHNALTVGDASAWLWWWYSGSSTNEGLYNGSTDTKRHYTYGNYTKFVRPGYIRVDITGNSNANLLLSAYKGTDGTVVVVAINKGTSAATVPIAIAGGTAPTSCTPNVTSASANLAAGTAVSVSGGSFSASLAGTTVTTFVCK